MERVNVKKTNTRTFGESLDYFFNKLLPKKLIVFVVATIIVFQELTVPEEYWWVLMVYLGVNVAGKLTGTLGKIQAVSTIEEKEEDVSG